MCEIHTINRETNPGKPYAVLATRGHIHMAWYYLARSGGKTWPQQQITMAVLWQTVNDIVWAKSFWLPGNYTWEDLKNKDDGIYHPQITDLLVPVYLSVFVYVVRYSLER